MSENEELKLFKRAEKILAEELNAENEKIMENQENFEAFTFLYLLKLSGIKLGKIDESKITKSKDWRNHLYNTQNVFAYETVLDEKWYKYDLGNFMGYLKEKDKPVILYRKGTAYFCLDLQTNNEFIINKDSSKKIKDTAILIVPLAPINCKSFYYFLFKTALTFKKEIIPFILLSIIVSIAAIIVPVFISSLVTKMSYANSNGFIIANTISMILVIISVFCANLIVSRMKVRCEIKFSQYVFIGFFNRVMKLAQNAEKDVANLLITKMVEFIGAIDSLCDSTISIITYLIQSVALSLLLLAISRSHARLILIYIMIMIIVTFIMEIYASKIKIKVEEKSKSLAVLRREIIDNIESIKNNASEGRTYYRFSIEFDNYIKEKLKFENINFNINIVSSLIPSGGIFLLLYSFYMFKSNDFSDMTLIYTSFAIFASYVTCLVMNINTFVENIPVIKLFAEVMKKEVESKNTNGIETRIYGGINISHLKFSYNELASPVLRDINMNISPGDYVGIVGSSGCGKSTLLKLLLGFEKATEGNICYDGIEISQFDLKHLRKQFGVVLQDCGIITDSILKNISSSDEPDMDRVIEVSKLAAIYDDIESMPMKFNTIISSEADLISGGQKQRIVIARALYNDPNILFMDEATSALDNVTQNVIKNNLGKLGITRIVIAHRLSTIIDCNKIFVLDKGFVAETGTYDELMKRNGLFATMAKRNLS